MASTRSRLNLHSSSLSPKPDDVEGNSDAEYGELVDRFRDGVEPYMIGRIFDTGSGLFIQLRAIR